MRKQALVIGAWSDHMDEFLNDQGVDAVRLSGESSSITEALFTRDFDYVFLHYSHFQPYSFFLVLEAARHSRVTHVYLLAGSSSRSPKSSHFRHVTEPLAAYKKLGCPYTLMAFTYSHLFHLPVTVIRTADSEPLPLSSRFARTLFHQDGSLHPPTFYYSIANGFRER